MKTLTITFTATSDVPVPTETGAGAGVGIRIVVTKPDTTTASPPVEQKLVWTFSNMSESARYLFDVAVVDVDGKVIQALPQIVADVPAAPTYTRLDGYTFAWS